MPAVLPPDDRKPPPDAGPPPNQDVAKRGGLAVAQLSTLQKGRVSTKDAMSLHTLVDAGKISYDQVAQVMPTYRVYVWYDTGTKAGTAKILTPMPAYGFLVAHDGDLTGWEHTLEGRGGAVLTRIAPNFYRVGVPNNGAVTVDTIINTKSCSTFLGIVRCCCNLAGTHEGTGYGVLTTLGLGLLMAARRRRRSAPRAS